MELGIEKCYGFCRDCYGAPLKKLLYVKESSINFSFFARYVNIDILGSDTQTKLRRPSRAMILEQKVIINATSSIKYYVSILARGGES